MSLQRWPAKGYRASRCVTALPFVAAGMFLGATVFVAARMFAGASLPVVAAMISLGTPWVLAAPPARPAVDLQCVSFGTGPQLDCTVRLQGAGGAPLDGAQVTLGASMPSMPMAHTVKPATAKATGRAGEYRGRLLLGMNGVWAVQVDVEGPVRDRIARSLRIDECEQDQRCPAPVTSAMPHKH